jgi:hypothetical protein
MKTPVRILSASIAALPAMLMTDIEKLPSGEASIVIASDSPHRGTIQAQVERRYRPAHQRMATVANFPILRWVRRLLHLLRGRSGISRRRPTNTLKLSRFRRSQAHPAGLTFAVHLHDDLSFRGRRMLLG